jgi:uncharacterized protein (DUF983 family)
MVNISVRCPACQTVLNLNDNFSAIAITCSNCSFELDANLTEAVRQYYKAEKQLLTVVNHIDCECEFDLP